MEPAYLAELLSRSNLSADDREIAVNVLMWSMTYVDAGEALGKEDETRVLDRSTVGWRMRTKIAPRLRELIARDIQKAGA